MLPNLHQSPLLVAAACHPVCASESIRATAPGSCDDLLTPTALTLLLQPVLFHRLGLESNAGFTAEAAERVGSHSPRPRIQTVGPQGAMRQAQALIKKALPQINVFFRQMPMIEAGRQ